MKTHKLIFTLERQTPGALRYQEVVRASEATYDFLPKSPESALVRTIYLRKNVLGPGVIPKRLNVTIEMEE